MAKYRVIQETDLKRLEDEVNRLLKPTPHLPAASKWKLAGGICVASQVSSFHDPHTGQMGTQTDFMYHQALVQE